MNSEKQRCVTTNKARNLSICIVFIAIIFSLSIATVLKKEKKFSSNENRVLQTKPKFTINTLFDGSYTKAYEDYITDQFVMRDQWIALKVYAELALQKKDINGVYFGEDGYLIQQHLASGVDEKLVTKNMQALKKFVDAYKENYNVKVMLVPTASNVLRDKLPKFAGEYNQDKLIDEMKQLLGADSFVDVREALNSHNEEYIYYKTDHHWTSLGAFYAYEEWAKAAGVTPFAPEDFTIKEVATDFLGTTYSKVNIPVNPDSIHLYEYKDSKDFKTILDHYPGMKVEDEKYLMDDVYNLEQLKGKDKYTVFLDGNHEIEQITSNVKNGKTLLVIKDSYAHTIVPVIAGHYEKVIMIDYRYFLGSTKELMESTGVTDVLVLYNTMNFVEDKNSFKFAK